jgi:CBS-domain-containing membrane protein
LPGLDTRVDAMLHDAKACMQHEHASGMPVIDLSGEVAGMLTEAYLLRCAEIGPEKMRSGLARKFFAARRTPFNCYINSVHGAAG